MKTVLVLLFILLSGVAPSHVVPANRPATLTSDSFASGLVAGQTYEVQFSHGFTIDTTPSNTLQVLIRIANGGVTGSGLSGSGANAGTLTTLTNIANGSYTTTLYFTPNANFANAFIVFRGTNAQANNLGSVLWVDNVVVQRRVPEIDGRSALRPLLLLVLFILVLHHRRPKNWAEEPRETPLVAIY